MKILILCDLFPPAFGPRMGYLCKYLVRNGWEPTVVTEHINEDMFGFLTGYAPVEYISYFKAKGKYSRKIEWLSVLLMDFLFNYKDRKMVKVASRHLKAGGYAAIICSTYRTFPLTATRKLAQTFNLPFVADLRDIIEQYAAHEYITRPPRLFPWLDRQIIQLFRHRLLHERNRALREAACITTVSPWHVEMLKAYNPRVELVYNGYDPEVFYPEKISAKQFHITYTGRIISLATRDPELLFKAISELSSNGEINPGELRIQWYIDDASREMLQPLIRHYGVSEYMDYHGYVAANRIPAILNASSILLHLANKAGDEGPKGIMTTKIFEYFAVEKPILCVRSDESYMAELLKLTNTGLAATQVEDVCDFIRHYFTQWKEQGYTSAEVNREATAAFSRSRQAEQFMRLFKQL